MEGGELFSEVFRRMWLIPLICRRQPPSAWLSPCSPVSPRSVAQSQGSAVSPPGFLNTDCRFGFANCNPSWLGCASLRRSFNAAIWDHPDEGYQNIKRLSEPRCPTGQGDGDNIDPRGYQALPVATDSAAKDR